MHIGAAISAIGLGNFDTAIVPVNEVIAGTPQVTRARHIASIHRSMGAEVSEADANRKPVGASPGLTMKQRGDALPPGMIQQSSTSIPWREPGATAVR